MAISSWLPFQICCPCFQVTYHLTNHYWMDEPAYSKCNPLFGYPCIYTCVYTYIYAHYIFTWHIYANYKEKVRENETVREEGILQRVKKAKLFSLANYDPLMFHYFASTHGLLDHIVNSLTKISRETGSSYVNMLMNLTV